MNRLSLSLVFVFLLSAVSSLIGQPLTGDQRVKDLPNPIRQKYKVPALTGAIVTSKGLKVIGAEGSFPSFVEEKIRKKEEVLGSPKTDKILEKPTTSSLLMKKGMINLILLASGKMASSAKTLVNTLNFQVWDKDHPPIKDARLLQIRKVETPCPLPSFNSRREWERRARELRQQILVSAGLWPEPPKTPLNPHRFGRIEREGYAVEKVYFESLPGFYVTGNLYLPLGRRGPFPGILCPHGHWREGRLEDGERGSVPARCINLARQGYVVFSYDMIGYNDSLQIPHTFGGPKENLWGLSLLGLQLWNSLRSVDFLCSLKEVDPQRIGCTGASGGGTQTFLLTAVDPRVKVSAPVNMVSAHYQGGCLCENAPGLRIDTSNVEITALTAPRPLLLVSATGDWTVNTPKVEYPALREIYRLYGAEERVSAVQFQAEHNYNKESREAVYTWFGRWLLKDPNPDHFKEQPYRREAIADLRVFPEGHLPEGSPSLPQIVQNWKAMAQSQWASLVKGDLRTFEKIYKPALKLAMALQIPKRGELLAQTVSKERIRLNKLSQPVTMERLVLGRKGKGDAIPCLWLRPPQDSKGPVLLVSDQGKASLLDSTHPQAKALSIALLERGYSILLVDPFLVGEARGSLETLPPEPSSPWTGRPEGKEDRFFPCYNRPDVSERIQDIVTSLQWLSYRTGKGVKVIGLGDAGLWALLAYPFCEKAEALAGDLNNFNPEKEEEYLLKLPLPGILRLGGITTVLRLVYYKPLLLFRTGESALVRTLQEKPQNLHQPDSLALYPDQPSTEDFLSWLGG